MPLYVPAGPLNNYAATVSPTVNDDSSLGYSVGSSWQNITTAQMYRCRSNTVGAAAWTQVDTADVQNYVSGNWYMPLNINVAAGGAGATASVKMVPLIIKQRVVLSAFGVRVTTLAAGGNLQLALYANNPTTGRITGPVLGATGNISTTVAGQVSAALGSGNITIEPGTYWGCMNVDATAGGTAIMQANALSASPASGLAGTATLANIGTGANFNTLNFTTPMAFGTWSDMTAAVLTEATNAATSGPAFEFKIA